MLPSQRAHFDIPSDVAYLNAAGWSPLPRATQEAARAAVSRKGQPWKLDPDFANSQHERARAAAAALIGADARDVALVSSVGYGVAIAGKVLVDPARLARARAGKRPHLAGAGVDRPRRRAGLHRRDDRAAGGRRLDLGRAGRDCAARRAALALASISSIHWSDGGLLDMDTIAKALRRQGAALLLDATHSVGVIATDVKTLDPDFLIFPTYKWVLGPYGRAFVYVARRHQDGVPLEQTSFGRRDVKAENPVYFADTRYLPDARRYDMGERDHFISMEMAAIGMEMMASWGADAVAQRLSALTRRIADGLGNAPVQVLDERLRAPHILSLGLSGRHAAEPDPGARGAADLCRGRASGACASRRTCTTTRPMSIVSSPP